MSILDKEKLNGSNFLDWYRNLRIVLRNEQKLHHLEEALPEAPPATATVVVRNTHTRRVTEQQEVACLMLQQAKQELFETVKAFHACKQEEGQSASTYVLKMKAYLHQMERLGYPMPLVLRVNLILTSPSKDYDQFVQNYNMHGMGNTIPELHTMLKLAEKSIPKKAPAVLAIRQGKIQKPKSQAQGKGKKRGKGKSKLSYDPKHKIPPPAKKEHPAKDTKYHHYHKTGHWKRNCPLYLAELKKNKSGTSGIFTIKMFSFPESNTWIYDTGFGTHICNTIQGLRGYQKLNKGALDLYVGNGNSAAVEAIGSFELILPCRMILVLENYHFSSSITRGIISLSCLWDKGFHHKFIDNGAISVSKDNIFYFNVIPRDGIFEIDMHNHISNERSIYTCSNKKPKHNLDSTFLCHCRLGHINKKRIEKLQHDRLLESIDDESFDVCVSCISGKMARKPFTHASERVDYLLGIIHSDVCRRFRTTSREASGITVDFDEIQKEDAQPFENTSQHQHEVEHDPVNPQTDVIPVRRSARIPQAPERYGFYTDAEEHELGDHGEPPNYRAALSDPDSEKWVEAMNAEMQSMKDNQVWNLVDLPPNCKTVGSKWLLKKKTDIDGNVHTYKAHLVAKGFTQTHEVDYKETFSPIVDIKAIRILIAVATYYDYEIWKMDVKTAFLNGRLNKDVYMVQPEGFVNPKHSR
ncbi:retrotransposon protein, putative, ty1-copia subclass [Tanacetum coccineum]|uniref:Retrotransposon protein, putative, ty1-copia subclass n=1 Tax=Tanacetum coccineum TaxID=301880 RepID=A0ABQ4XR15_9ASTR